MGKHRVLIIGSGGREHALAWKLSQSPELECLFVAPGNAGTVMWNVPIPVQDIAGLVEFALKENIDLTVVGPEDPLSLGIGDAFKEAGLRIFGPNQAAAQLEGSKSFAKTIMESAQVPTAKWQVFEDPILAKEFIQRIGAPCVLKADGLAAGKGVIVAMDLETAIQAVDEIMDGSFGSAGKKLLVEEFLEGQEVSLLCFSDGKTALPMVPVQDHKRALDGDLGLNTGGMGTYSPPPIWTDELETTVMRDLVVPTLRVMEERGAPFVGVLFLGLMLTDQGPKLLEYNVRFGDPETQVVMKRMESDLLPILWACTEGRLSEVGLEWKKEVAVCVVMAAQGYPLAYIKGTPIKLPDNGTKDAVIFHAGTGISEGELVSAGGRVLGVTAEARTLQEAREKAYALVDQIDFPNAHYRQDIGLKGLG
ncbi:phosphoribosylamine--glycine ligase [Desulfosporosinus orientis DSM 765]|uniref:Phosphoribosylamine--glycine ligase n=1 Tax=Desulfosporosinus orientis (strain ATCC 19365 / DSM 765 / NCIMB 8382 / VKM B-1628 / Singapore I) TaxID=768706 RepID=G7W7X7_DESOD|nr:phosphoribosylamine--glycine ligase [Desulfosporosinus orientis]AET66403.1 phosphoribosylamine--glycine ligase [Desulfosporosinus orientis DSM 765]